jgi:phosphoribosylformylglycinamidine synthase
MDQASYMISPGDPCFTAPEAKKIEARFEKLGVNVEIRGVWIHYTHIRHSADQGTTKVSN